MLVEGEMMDQCCNICEGDTELFMRLGKIPPLQNRFYHSVDRAQSCLTTDVTYRYCLTCDHIMVYKKGGLQFDPTYDNSDIASPIMLSHYRDVVNEVKKNCPDKNGKIVEIGCGRGELLYMLKEAGYGNIKGYDPASPVNNDVIAQKYWSHQEDDDIDCLIMRHTIEEIPNILNFMKASMMSLGEQGKVYCEITNVSSLKNINGVFSMYSEYCQLFSSYSLSKLFFRCGMSVTSIESIDNGMRIGVWAKRNNMFFNDVIMSEMEKLKGALKKCSGTIVIWGAAGRCGNLLAFLQLDLSVVKFVVDINKNKQGKFIPPFGQQVVSPEDLLWIKPKTVLVANKKYILEVKEAAPATCTVFEISDFL